jgi:hypothetical protein
MQSNAQSRPEIPAKGATQFSSLLSFACEGLARRFSDPIDERDIYLKSISELIGPIFDFTRMGEFSLQFARCAGKGL